MSARLLFKKATTYRDSIVMRDSDAIMYAINRDSSEGKLEGMYYVSKYPSLIVDSILDYFPDLNWSIEKVNDLYELKFSWNVLNVPKNEWE